MLCLEGATIHTFPSRILQFIRRNDKCKIMCASLIKWQYVCGAENLCAFAAMVMSLNMVFGVGNSRLYKVQYEVVELLLEPIECVGELSPFAKRTK